MTAWPRSRPSRIGLAGRRRHLRDPQEHLDFRNAIRQIVQERVAPRAAEIDATGEYPWDVRELLAEHDVLGGIRWSFGFATRGRSSGLISGGQPPR
jgi:alkylation response protein AidB-like acyl-CoA dehydrogenase